MSTKIFFLFIFLSFSITSYNTHAQYKVDTIYYDKNNEKTTIDNAARKVIIIHHDSLNKVTDVTSYYDFVDIRYVAQYSDYEKGELNGRYISYHKNGTNKRISEHKNGQMHGIYQTFYPNGQIRRSEIYQDNQLKSGNYYNEDGSDTSYYPLLVKSEYIGKYESFQAAISKILKYPPKAKRAKIEGRVILTFFINTNGATENIEVKQSAHPLLDQAALEAIQKAAQFSISYEDGYPTNFYYKIPINFKLGSE